MSHNQKMTQDFIRANLEQLFAENGVRLSQFQHLRESTLSLADLFEELEKRVAKLEETK